MVYQRIGVIMASMEDKEVKLSKKEIKQMSNAMIFQTLECFDLHAFEGCNISDNQKEEVLNEIFKTASKYMNEYSSIGSTPMIIDEIVRNRKVNC